MTGYHSKFPPKHSFRGNVVVYFKNFKTIYPSEYELVEHPPKFSKMKDIRCHAISISINKVKATFIQHRILCRLF